MIETNLKPAALVTGGSRGIGAAIVELLASRGAPVINIDRATPPAGQTAEFIEVDLTNVAATREILDGIVKRRPVLWLVNNAGIALPASLDDTNLDDLDKVLAVNLRATIMCTQAVVPGMRAAGRGRIVNITSRAALGKELRTAYAAAKAGVLGLTRTWALELAGAGITVNAVGPGPIETELFRSSNPPDSPRTKAILEGIPLRRLGTPADVAHAVGFFLSEEASFVTGQTLFVCGGLTAGISSA
ncbi:MAG: SDR family oxidoreductase [Hyphomicrobiaceae bacterium]|nr:SDR family oxidoreductase [Hyphomicrobiaceae bacterium]